MLAGQAMSTREPHSSTISLKGGLEMPPNDLLSVTRSRNLTDFMVLPQASLKPGFAALGRSQYSERGLS